MKKVKLVFLVITAALFFSHTSHGVGIRKASNAADLSVVQPIQSIAAQYRITDNEGLTFLKKVAAAKNATTFMNENESYFRKAPKNLREAAYWLAEKLHKTDLTQKMLVIIEE